MARQPKLTCKDLTGVIAYMPTPVRDHEITCNVRDVVNLDEAARATDSLISDGCTGLCLNGTFGEVCSLSWEELHAFTAAVVDAAAGRVPVFAGATTLNTRDTVKRAQAFVDLGADGLMLGRPMMASMSDANTLHFYRDVAKAVPELAIIVYDDAEAFKRPISTRLYGELSKIRQIIGAKYRSRLLIGAIAHNTYNADFAVVDGGMRLLTQEVDWPFVYRNFGEEACWSSTVTAGPAPIMALRDALDAHDWDKAQTIQSEIAWTLEGIIPKEGFEIWHEDKIPFMKTRIGAAGYVKCGPPLPPYTEIAPNRRATAEELGRRASQLQERYIALQVGSTGYR